VNAEAGYGARFIARRTVWFDRLRFNDDDPQLFINALGHLAKHHGMSEVARAAGLNRESLYKVFSGKAQPRWDTVRRLMKALHVDLTVAA